MWMTYASYMQFYENVDITCYEAFGHHGETKGVPQQRLWKWCHGNILMIRQLVEIPVQKKVWMWACHVKGGGVILDTGFPHVGGMESVRESWIKGSSGVRPVGHGPDWWAVKIQDRRLSPVSGWDSPWRGRRSWCPDMKIPFFVTDFV